MQWGGLSDPFDNFEKKYGITLELLEFFDEIDYPLSLSTKGVFWTKDDRYMSLFKKHTHNWHVKVSIITSNPFKAAALERGVPSPTERLEAIKELSDIGINTTLRLRPYIIGVSEDYKDLIQKAHDAGANSVTTEFFCCEFRAGKELKAKYKEISKYCGYDIQKFYTDNTKERSGLYRLNYTIKTPIINEMKQLAHNLNMRFYVSDAHHKEDSDFCCCCGVPPEWNVAKGHFAQALQIAKQNGTVKWGDIKEGCSEILGDVRMWNAPGYNIGGTKNRAQRYHQTLCDFLQELWNTPTAKNSPYRYFEGALTPLRLDENNNIVYKYNR